MQAKFRLITLLSACLIQAVLTGHVCAKSVVYFWYDDDGVIHFAEQRPQGKRVYAVDMVEPASDPQAKSKYSYEELFKDAAEKSKIAAEKKEKADKQVMNTQRCDAAKHALWVLDNKNFVRQQNSDGTLQTLSFEQKQEIRERSQQEVAKYCHP